MSLASFEWITAAQRLKSQGRAFALVSVLRVEAPTSARPGDKALVTHDGHIEGWIGGGCAQPAVLRTVRQVLADGRARMIRIAPAAEGQERDLGDVLEFGMACHSGGTIELFVDPVLPAARIVVVGDSPVAVSLSELAPRVGMAVTVIAHGADAAQFPDAEHVLANDDDAAALAGTIGPGAFVVVATQGRRDLQGLRAALALHACKVFFVASARKADVLRSALLAAGHDAASVAAIVAPAGKFIGAQTPQEIALAVLSAVVAAWREPRAAANVDARRRERAADAAVADAPAAAKTIRPLPLPEPVPTGGSCCSGA